MLQERGRTPRQRDVRKCSLSVSRRQWQFIYLLLYVPTDDCLFVSVMDFVCCKKVSLMKDEDYTVCAYMDKCLDCSYRSRWFCKLIITSSLPRSHGLTSSEKLG